MDKKFITVNIGSSSKRYALFQEKSLISSQHFENEDSRSYYAFKTFVNSLKDSSYIKDEEEIDETIKKSKKVKKVKEDEDEEVDEDEKTIKKAKKDEDEEVDEKMVKTVATVLKQLGYTPSSSLKKSIMVDKTGKIIKNVDGQEDARTIDVGSMSEAEFKLLPKETQEEIFSTEFMNRLRG